MANFEKPGNQENRNQNEDKEAVEKALRGAREFSQKEPSEITEPELDNLIEEFHAIEGVPQTQSIYGILVDLRMNLCRPDLAAADGEGADALMRKLQSAVE